MKIVIGEENNIILAGENIVFAKGGAPDGGLQICEQSEATDIWDLDKNLACAINYEIIELEEVPKDITYVKYKYTNNEFIKIEKC